MLKKEYQPLGALARSARGYGLPGNVRELSGRIKKYETTGSEEMLLAEEHAIGPLASRGPAHAERPARPAPREERTFMPLKEASAGRRRRRSGR